MNFRHFFFSSTVVICMTLTCACAGCIEGDVNIGNINLGSNNPTIEFSIYTSLAVLAYALMNRRSGN